MGASQTREEASSDSIFFEYSASKEYTIQSDIVENDKNQMTEPGFDLILDCNNMKELGIFIDFQTKEITLDDILLPMRDIKNL